jgi:glucose-6-phosphate dehydrogenase assembly protein OpcA
MATQTFLADVGSIEQQLRQLWKGEARDLEAGESVCCSRTLNLIVFSSATEDTERTAELLDPVTIQHPARVILVSGSRADAGEDLQARVSASCLISHVGSRYIGRELIVLNAKATAHDRLASMIDALLIPGLPTFLWWRDSVARYPAIFQRLAASAGRVIIDSANLQNPLADFPQVEQIIKLCPDSAISDLAWSRITQWRQLTAQFFDGPVQASYFPQLRSIVVEQTTASGGGDRIGAEAILLAAWLACRLECGDEKISRIKSGQGSLVWELKSKQKSVTIEFRKSPLAFAGIATVQLTAEGKPPARYIVSKTKDGTGLETKTILEGNDAVRRVVRAGDDSLARWLIQELRILGRDEIYEQAIELVCALARQTG